ncbi:MAG: DNA polymerase I [Deltaproteobacteria bacterium]|nr:DNA polymerase I [Deltaproteobacteria bacterium]
MFMKKQLLLIDGSSYIYRAFHAIPHLSNSKGLPTNAIYGFAQMLLKVIKDFKTDHIAVAFDVKGPSFRHKMYEEYKAHRPEMPDSLKPQIPYIKELVRAFNIPALEMQGYEADDIIGTLSRHMREKNIEVIIIAADKDMLQLIDENTTMIDTMKDKRFSVQEVRKRFGVEADRVVEIMGLAGDDSDNIPGVKGIGEKTAVKLIREFGTIENLLSNIDKVKEKGIREKLEKYAEDARLSRMLAVIDTNAPVAYTFEELAVKPPDYSRLKELLKELEFSKLLKEIIQEEPAEEKGEYTAVTDRDALKKLTAEIKQAGGAAIAVMTVRSSETCLKPAGSQRVKESESQRIRESGSNEPQLFNTSLSQLPTPNSQLSTSSVVAFCLKPHQAFYVSIDDDGRGQAPLLPARSILEIIKPMIEDEGIKKMSSDIKNVYLFFKQHGIDMKGVYFDTGIASYLLNPSRSSHTLEDIAYEQLGRQIRVRESKSQRVRGSRVKGQDLDAVCAETCAEADAVCQLAEKMLPQLEGEGLLKLFNEMEMPLAKVLAEMERSGIKVDRDYLVNLSKELEGRIEILKNRIYTIAGADFNISSPKQLAAVLFDKLKLKPVKKTKTGFSTDEEVLNILAAQHELPAEILNFRQLSKLKSTYVDALLELINPKTRRIHTSFNQTVTATGRLSSSEPNLQNIPIRTELGKRIRQAFIADEGWLFLSADYSQIELRIVAHFSQDSLLIDAFKKDEDVHTRTAAEVFNVQPELVTSEMRRRAKAINFGIIYGMGAYGLAAELGISQDEARGYIDDYFLYYKGVKAFIDKTISEAMERGYVSTFFGRRRHVPEIRSESEQIRRFGERITINTPIQGTAADIIKVAMINIFRRLKNENLQSRMLLQIHDELIFEVPEKEIELMKGLVKKEMETAAKLSVPVKVDIQAGRNWGELE